MRMDTVMKITETEADWDGFITAELARLKVGEDWRQRVDDHEMIHRVLFATARGFPIETQPEYVQRRFKAACSKEIN